MMAPFVPGGPVRAVQHLNAACLWNLPDWSAAPKDALAQLEALAARGVEAIQHRDRWRQAEVLWGLFARCAHDAGLAS